MDKIQQTTQKIVDFRDKRDWKQFHKPKDIALSMSIELGELLECFQWKSDEQIQEMMKTDKRQKVEEEVADIGNYLLLLCNELEIDLIDVITKKLEQNDAKYPVEKAYGKSTKYTDL